MYFRIMKKKSFKKIAISALLPIWVGGAIIIATEIFILDGRKDISFSDINFFDHTDLSTQEIARLRNNHNRYMGEGIIPTTKTARAPETPLIAAKESTNERHDLVDTGPAPNFSMDIIIAEQRGIESLTSIEPASGTEGDYRPNVSISQNNPFEKTLDDVLAEITPASNNHQAETSHKHIVEEPFKEHNDAPEQTNVYKYTKPTGNGLIAIIIDDMGLTLRSKIVENMEAPLTLSYLPNAKNINDRTKQAKKNGHEIMLHMPMEPLNTAMDDGSIMLRVNQSQKDFKAALDWSLNQTDIFVGVNNHMGSKLTSNKDAMNIFMRFIMNKEMFFVDSKTIGTSVAAKTAKEFGIPYAERDVFLDHEISKEFIERALRKTETIAQKKGYAIAIAHPHKETIAALKNWLPTLKDKGLTLVPASRLINTPTAQKAPLLASQ